MRIIVSKTSELNTLASTNAGKFTIAVNQWIASTNSTTSSITNTVWTGYIAIQDSDSNVLQRGLSVGGNNNPILDVMPKYFPVATKGAECCALVSSLGWADLNLTNYEYIQLGTGQGESYLVTGVLNSSQTQANDPFGTEGQAQGFTSGCCWAGTYTEGLNPF